MRAVACGAPPAPDPWTLWTIDTLARRGDPAFAPSGSTLRLLSSPYEAGAARQKAGQDGLTIFPAFVEGQTAAYLTTEVWQHFDAVWVQPLYLPVTRYDQNGPGSIAAPAIFGVNATTRFYSPYWQVFYFVNPPGAQFKSAREVLDSGVALHPAAGKFCPVTQDAALLPAQTDLAGPVRPLSDESIAPVRNFSAYADGDTVRYLELGAWGLNVFTWDYQTLIVHDTPLFAFTRVGADGSAAELDLPRVGGTGPLHHPTCDGRGHCAGLQSNGIPQFGALWQVYDVSLPPTADVFVPADNPDLRRYEQAQGFVAAVPTATGPDLDQFTLRVTTTPQACFADPHDDKCVWLDSQNAIEDNLPDWRITETETLVSCPLVRFNGLPKP